MSDITKLNKANYVMRNGEIALFDKVNEVIDTVNGSSQDVEILRNGNGFSVVTDVNENTLGFADLYGPNDYRGFKIFKTGNIITVAGSVVSNTNTSGTASGGGTLLKFDDINFNGLFKYTYTFFDNNYKPIYFEFILNNKSKIDYLFKVPLNSVLRTTDVIPVSFTVVLG